MKHRSRVFSKGDGRRGWSFVCTHGTCAVRIRLSQLVEVKMGASTTIGFLGILLAVMESSSDCVVIMVVVLSFYEYNVDSLARQSAGSQ